MSSLELAYEETINGWLRALALKDGQTEAHCIRLAELSVAFGQNIGIKKKELSHLRRSALLHDIGKIGIPGSILIHAGPLTDEDRKLMEMHPKFGYEILAQTTFLKTEAEIVYCHHEYWDGNGYPRGLKGEEIPKLARIVTVCNVWEALTSDQPYRKAWSKSDARNYIDLGSEKEFDPELVYAFLAYIDKSYF